MVQAILAGNKRQTRRVVVPQPVDGDFIVRQGDGYQVGRLRDSENAFRDLRCPYASDVLWVRETWRQDDYVPEETIYQADAPDDVLSDTKGIIKWRPAIHMPRTRARLFLDVLDIECERLQSMDEDDACAEGVEPEVAGQDAHGAIKTYRTGYVRLWNKLNEGRGYGWLNNPWVWVIVFERRDYALEEAA